MSDPRLRRNKKAPQIQPFSPKKSQPRIVRSAPSGMAVKSKQYEEPVMGIQGYPTPIVQPVPIVVDLYTPPGEPKKTYKPVNEDL